MRSTMQDGPLTITSLLRHGGHVYADSEVVTATTGGTRRTTFAEVAERAERLAAALKRLGVGRDDRVATFAWNNQEHLEAYLAVPSMGAVLHTLNIRLFPDQLAYVADHAQDKVVIVDASLVPLLATVLGEMSTVEHVLVVGEADTEALEATGKEIGSYQAALAAEEPGYPWPDLNEQAAAAMCYTSGTTGNPKGVVYSHRSTWLHSVATCMGNIFGLTERDRALPVVPMFHANAWGLPYAAWIAGADLVLPDRWLQAEPLTRLITGEAVTFAAGVPTVWNDVLNYGKNNDVDLSSLRLVIGGGSAVPRALMERWAERFGVTMLQAWGMTETSPLASVSRRPKTAPEAEEWTWRAKTGRVVAGVEARIVDDGSQVLPCDGEAVGEFEVRGPWITASYHLDPDPGKFHDGWLRTGDVGTFDDRGFMQITDRSKDVIKSGGEWISSVELENELMGHPDILEAAVVGVPDDRWQERPLACVVPHEGADIDAGTLAVYLGDKVASWWVPERWAVIEAVPRTSVGKFDKKVLRARYADGELPVEQLAPPTAAG